MESVVKLYLKNHCIETEAKMEYRRLLGLFFSEDNPAAELSERIEILRIFIEQENFSALRSSDNRLCGMSESTVNLERKGDHVDMLICDKDEQPY